MMNVSPEFTDKVLNTISLLEADKENYCFDARHDAIEKRINSHIAIALKYALARIVETTSMDIE